jgi:hypothetical protein
MGMNNTLPIAQTRIIQPIMFTKYLSANISFFLNFDRVMQYPSKFQKICCGVRSIFGIP